MEVKSAARVLELVEYLTASARPTGLAELREALAIPKSSAHALCQTLVARGYAVQDRHGRYSLLDSRRHGFPYRPGEERLVEHAYPIMQQLRDATGETVILSTMTARGEIRRLAKSVSRQAVRYDVEMNAPIASFCTASGRVLLAARSDRQIEVHLAHTSLLSYTAFTRTDRAQIDALIAMVRKEGYAINDEEFITGSTGIAAPVRDREGAMAALNLGTLSSRFHVRRQEFIASVCEAARLVSERLGGVTANG